MGVATGGYHRWQPFFCAYLCIENLPSEEVMKFSAGGSFSMRSLTYCYILRPLIRGGYKAGIKHLFHVHIHACTRTLSIN